MTPIAGEIAIAIAGSTALSLIAKATVVSAAALAVARLARTRRASVRHIVLATTFIVLLALPLVPAVLPARQVTMPLLAPARNIAAVTVPPVPGALVAVPQSADGGPAATGRQSRTLPSRSMVLVAAWVVGTTVLLVLLIAGLIRVRRVRRNGVPWRDGEVLVAGIASALAVRRPIQVLLDGAANGPMTCGVVWPVIILPRDAQQWPVEDLRRAVVHEIEHVRRADWLTLCLARSVCAVYWFHPLVWMLWRHLRLEAERACDDAVLCSAEPETYADQLVALAERLISKRAQSALAMADRNDLSARVSAVLDSRQPRGRAGATWIVSAVVAAAGLITAIAPLRAVAIARSLPDPADSFARVEAVSVTTDTAAPQQTTETSAPQDLNARVNEEHALPPSLESVFSQRLFQASALASAPVAAAASQSAARPQSPDAFRIGAANRPNRTPADPELERQLEEAFTSGGAWTDLSLTADVTFRQLNRAEYAVPVSVRIAPGSELALGRGERSRLDFIASVTDLYGITVANMRDAAELTLDAASIAALAKTPIVYDTSFILLPGRYTLKVLARDQTTGRIGSTNVAFTIPNLNKQQQKP